MKLTSLEIFNNKDQIAWVGAGGKTSLIFAIAKELFSEKCVITTTTKMALAEKDFADHSIITEEIEEIDFSLVKGINFVCKGNIYLEPTKVNGFTKDQLKLISETLKNENIPLFVEADGSNRKPLKFPAEHEPVIPKFVNKVCLVVGLSSIGKKLNQENFHRPELISKLLDLPINSIITWHHLYILLSDEKGWVRNFPEGVEKIVFLNQADSLSDHKEVNKLALKLLNYYDHVLLTSIQENELSITAHWNRMGCAILAAGSSSRFGSPKQLAKFQNKTFIENVIHAVKRINFLDVVVVLGANYEQIKPIIDSQEVPIIHNKAWQEGQSTSVKECVKFYQPKNVEAIIFLLVDQPQIQTNFIETIIHTYAYHKSPVIVHDYKNQNRHPILFSKRTFDDLLQITGEKGGSQLFEKYPPQKISIKDPFYSYDVDKVEDLEKLKN